MLAKGKERLPGCGLKRLFALLVGVAEGGGKATPASCSDVLGAWKQVLEAWEWSWDVTLGSSSGKLWREIVWRPVHWCEDGYLHGFCLGCRWVLG